MTSSTDAATTADTYREPTGELRWDHLTGVLRDVTDGYLTGIAGIERHPARDRHLHSLFSTESSLSDAEPSGLGRQLLQGVSQLHSLAIEHSISGEYEADILYRLVKFVPVVSKLSDEYARSDSIYAEQWHGDLIDICDAIVERNRALTTDGGSSDD
jgi:hypothetical protein